MPRLIHESDILNYFKAAKCSSWMRCDHPESSYPSRIHIFEHHSGSWQNIYIFKGTDKTAYFLFFWLVMRAFIYAKIQCDKKTYIHAYV